MSWAGLCPRPPGSGAVAGAGITRQRDVSVAGVGAWGGAPKSPAFPGVSLRSSTVCGRPDGPAKCGPRYGRRGVIRVRFSQANPALPVTPCHFSAAEGAGARGEAATQAGARNTHACYVFSQAPPALRRPLQWQQLEPPLCGSCGGLMEWGGG